jgi:hypothetical protein
MRCAKGGPEPSHCGERACVASGLCGERACVASGLARVGLRSSPSKGTGIFLKALSARFWGCCATQREQARSPQEPVGYGYQSYQMYQMIAATNHITAHA